MQLMKALYRIEQKSDLSTRFLQRIGSWPLSQSHSFDNDACFVKCTYYLMFRPHKTLVKVVNAMLIHILYPILLD